MNNTIEFVLSEEKLEDIIKYLSKSLELNKRQEKVAHDFRIVIETQIDKLKEKVKKNGQDIKMD